MKKERVLITGGAGFIGSAVAKEFHANGFNVRTFDIFEPKNVSYEHFFGTVMYPTELYRAARDCGYVVHLAAMLGVKRTEEHRMDCLDINIQGTKNVLESAVKAGVKKIILASSSEVYGEANKPIISENDPVIPKSVYAVTKLAGEEYLKAYQKSHGLDYSVVRFFNVYGPGQIAEFVMPMFIKSVLENQSPTVYGNGKQIRSFCYVDDAARGVRLMLESGKSNGHIFNIGNDRAATTMVDLARKVIELAGKKIEPKFVEMTDSDRKEEREILKRIPDITKARTILNYNPSVGLDEGILKTIEARDIRERREKI